MHLIAPDILAEARGLSFPFSALGVALGALLWTFGWRWHRFWVVLFTTVVAGIYGLNLPQAGGPKSLALGMLLAVSAGLLAIDLSRFVAFATSGLACWYLVHAVVPAFHEPLICFLAGGIVGILLYRLQLMLLSSFVGAVVAAYSVLLIIETLSKDAFVAADWAKSNGMALNIAIAALSLIGMAVQGQLERWRDGKEDREREKAIAALSSEERGLLEQFRRRWFDWSGYRRSA